MVQLCRWMTYRSHMSFHVSIRQKDPLRDHSDRTLCNRLCLMRHFFVITVKCLIKWRKYKRILYKGPSNNVRYRALWDMVMLDARVKCIDKMENLSRLPFLLVTLINVRQTATKATIWSLIFHFFVKQLSLN